MRFCHNCWCLWCSPGTVIDQSLHRISKNWWLMSLLSLPKPKIQCVEVCSHRRQSKCSPCVTCLVLILVLFVFICVTRTCFTMKLLVFFTTNSQNTILYIILYISHKQAMAGTESVCICVLVLISASGWTHQRLLVKMKEQSDNSLLLIGLQHKNNAVI